MLVATMTFLRPSDVGSKMRACRSAGICEYIGNTDRGAGSSSWSRRSTTICQLTVTVEVRICHTLDNLTSDLNILLTGHEYKNVSGRQ